MSKRVIAQAGGPYNKGSSVPTAACVERLVTGKQNARPGTKPQVPPDLQAPTSFVHSQGEDDGLPLGVSESAGHREHHRCTFIMG